MTICSRTIKKVNDREERTYSQMLLLLQIVPLWAKCLHRICRVPEWRAVDDYSFAFCALHIRQIHFVKYPDL